MEDPCKDACRERCAEFGDPPCFEIDARSGEQWSPCDDCKRDCGVEVLEKLDPEAVLAPLL